MQFVIITSWRTFFRTLSCLSIIQMHFQIAAAFIGWKYANWSTRDCGQSVRPTGAGAVQQSHWTPSSQHSRPQESQIATTPSQQTQTSTAWDHNPTKFNRSKWVSFMFNHPGLSEMFLNSVVAAWEPSCGAICAGHGVEPANINGIGGSCR